METRNYKILMAKLREKSVRKTNHEIKMEWKYVFSKWTDDALKCLCTHDIHELCHIFNIKNDNKEIVGNCCVNNFLFPEWRVDLEAHAIKRILNDRTKSFKGKTLHSAHEQNWISKDDYDFYNWTKNAQAGSLLGWKLDKRIKINYQILTKVYQGSDYDFVNGRELPSCFKSSVKGFLEKWNNYNFHFIRLGFLLKQINKTGQTSEAGGNQLDSLINRELNWIKKQIENKA